jgi:hypothetical protein
MAKKAAKPSELSTPHRVVQAADRREHFALELFDALWQRYRERVSFVRDYEGVVHQAGATFVNDHIAFRTIACQQPPTGISTLSRVFEALGYVSAGCYNFPDKHLGSLHYQHANAAFPKLFISELKLWEMSAAVQKIVLRTLKTHRSPLPDRVLVALRRLEEGSAAERQRLLATLVRFFHQLPWSPPSAKDVKAVNEESQFAAWVLVHGYNVNHFTALINSHGVSELDDIEKTIDRLRSAGVPMKAEIEGARGSKLRQTATEAVMLNVPTLNGRRKATMPWTYAYFELAQRGEVVDPQTGRLVRFEGFLGPQATQLFEMTRVREVSR